MCPWGNGERWDREIASNEEPNITAGNPNLDGDATPAFTINNSGQIAMADSDDKAVVMSLT